MGALRKADGQGSPDTLRTAERNKRRTLNVLLIRLAVFAGVVMLIGTVFYAGAKIVMATGKNSLFKNADSRGPMLDPEPVTEGGNETSSGAADGANVAWKEGWVRQNGKIYEYNDDILTFLVMGIDKSEEVSESKDATDGGQSDGLFLTIINPDLQEIQILAINRDTMTEIQMYGFGEGDDVPMTTAQIAVQHGFGDGRELSCELTVEAVSKLLYDLPIHGYVSINYGALPVLNDALGGIEVTMSQDLSVMYKDWKVGAVVTLKGIQARDFVQYRDTTQFESARMRLSRQKEYMNAFAAKAIAETKKDITLPVTLYGKVKKYIVTDLSINEMTYLASELSGYHFGDIYTLEGETQQGLKFEEFYPDKAAMRDMIIRLFYREVITD